MAQIKVTPVDGARVRKENGVVLKAEGEIVERSAFWLRRRNDGAVAIEDVSEASVAAPADAPSDVQDMVSRSPRAKRAAE